MQTENCSSAIVCGKRFSDASSLKKYCRIHISEKRFECDVYIKESSDASNLKRHRQIHTGEKSFNCEKEFSNASSLKRHRRKHTGEKPFNCSVCGKEFNDLSNMKKHHRKHTFERPFKYDVCDKKFDHKRSVERLYCMKNIQTNNNNAFYIILIIYPHLLQYTVPPIKRLSPSIYLDASHRVPRIPRVARPVNLSRTSRLCSRKDIIIKRGGAIEDMDKNPTEAQIMNSCAIHLSGFSETYNGTVPPITVPESMRPLLPTSSLASVLNSSFSWIPHHFQNEKSHNFS
ncbi:hypothetical protein DINM_020009 [Dirofilaria immitis]|nr:hypothetical protein [Dirofilaria immitis]